ncbi:hypothetical protein MY4824_001763 [Beauveria thailandica]
MAEMVQQTEPPPPPPPPQQPQPASTTAATTSKKRRRPPLSCEQCRRRKIKCDRSFPCNHCSKSGGAVSCTYAPAHTPKSRSKKPARAAATAATAPPPRPPPAQTASSSPCSPSSPGRSVSLRPAAAAPPRLRPTARATQIHTPDSEEFHRGSTWQPLRPSSASYSTAAGPPPAGRPLSPAVIHEQVEAKQAHRDASRSSTTAAAAAAAAAAATTGGVEAQRRGNERHARRRSEYTPPPKGSTSKGRYFGQSHWMNIAASFPVELSMLKNQEHTKGELFQVLHQCKILCQKIKHSRLQPLSSLNIGKNMLPRDVCDDLVHAYTSTYEGVLRVLHLPTFWKEYAGYWEDPCSGSSSNEAFVVLMQLCIVLGSSVRDRTEALRATTTRWIYEAHVWLILPPEKGRMTLTGIQIMCLLTLAKMTCGVSSDLTWTMAGSLLRTAMYMGLHRDPSHLSEMTVYKAEMRRRLWATILELNLQYSFEAGGMPLISCDDYDTLPPADLDDDALDDDAVDDVTRPRTRSSSGAVATQMSVPLEVFKSFPVRLGLLQYINDFRAGIDYDKTLRFNAELTRACRSFSQTMGALIRRQNGAAMRDPSAAKAPAAAAAIINTFHVSLAEVTLYRCFHALHFPVLFTAFDDPRFYFSRKMCLDGALKVADLWGFSPQSARQQRRAGGGGAPCRDNDDGTFCAVSEDFERLTLYGTGLFKNVPVQAACIIALELIHDRGGGGGVGVGGGGGGGGALRLGASSLPTAAAGYADLRACLDAALDWTLRRMRAGEVTAKGHCFLSACVAHTEALEQGLGKTATVKLLVERATDAARVDLALLRDVARESGVLVEEQLPLQQQHLQQQQYGGTGTGADGGGGMFEDNGAAVVEALVAGWDCGGGWAWDETDDWMWGGAWSQLNVPMPLDDVHQFFETPVGYPRGRNADTYPPVL